MRKLLFTVVLCSMTQLLLAQQGNFDTIRLAGIVIGNDTLPHYWLREVRVLTVLDEDALAIRKERRAQMNAYNALRRTVYTVYPYAVQAGFILNDIDSALNALYSKEAKQAYKLRKENELNRRFKNELENLSITQGQILVKLIARQTGKPCYQIIKELKGGLNARIWQTVALLFDNNLKNNYDPTGEDYMIEAIVQEIEAQGHFERRN